MPYLIGLPSGKLVTSGNDKSEDSPQTARTELLVLYDFIIDASSFLFQKKHTMSPGHSRIFASGYHTGLEDGEFDTMNLGSLDPPSGRRYTPCCEIVIERSISI